MTSTIRVTSAGPAPTGTTTNLMSGLTKVWVNYNGTGTIATRDSFNVSGIADEGTGACQTNFTTSMNNVNYAISGSAGSTGGASGCWHTTGFNVDSYNTSNQTGSFHTQIYYTTSNATDTEFVYSAIDGDLA